MGCTGCNCTSRRAAASAVDDPHQGDYASIWTQAEPDSARELLVVNHKDCPVNLSLTQHGLVVVKRKPGSLHSLKLSHGSATSTRTIPYLCVLAATCSAGDVHTVGSGLVDTKTSGSGAHVTISALVPRNRGQPDGPLKLWKLQARVPAEQDSRSPSGSAHDATRPDHVAKAQRWCKSAEEHAYEGVKRYPKLHCVVNPIGGKGKAKAVWNEAVKPIFEAAGCQFDVSFTGPPRSPTNASAIASKHPSSTYDALVAFSGDGIVHELLNGLANHTSGKGRKVLRETPIVHVPCGSGNALATSLLGPDKVGDVRWAALAALKGKPLAIDLSSLTQSSGKRIFTFLSQAFGLMADLDLGTEHLRWMGDARFTYGYLKGAMERRTYPLQLDVDVVSSSRSDIARRHNDTVQNAHSADVKGTTVDTSSLEDDQDALPPLRLPGIFESFSEPATELRQLPERGGVEPGCYSIDLSQDGVFFLYGGKVPYVSKDVMMFPAADPNDGLIDLAIFTSMGRVEALQAMDGADSGALFSHRALTYLKVKSYRLNFTPKQGGCISIDGEEVPYEAFQVEVHQGLARVLSPTGRWEGRRQISGFD
ncbi:hypothetical protein JCM10908_000365 [Rhodotorula pacifica]|uniref:uncharacterized protein n=1 Tax=Rhodotorula pacifica TaxID=1495444 RepID=UPI00316E4C33